MTKQTQRIIILYTALCFLLNSTFSIRRDMSKGCNDVNRKQQENCLERTKRMVSFGNTLRKIKDTTHTFGRNIYDHLNMGFKTLANKSNINEDDIRQYEQLVIMKKYPYLDVHELDMKYLPKKEIASDRLYLDRGTQHEVSFSDLGEDKINVEITNRGLSGFVIPPHLSKHGMVESKSAVNSDENPGNFIVTKISSNSNVLRSLRRDINEYFDKRNLSAF